MLALDQGLQELLITVNSLLRDRTQNYPRRDAIRRYLREKIGTLQKRAPLKIDALRALADGRPLIGVDGSVHSYGTVFPHIIYCFRALASASTLSVEKGISRVDLFYPEMADHRREIEEIISQAAAGGEELALETAAARAVRQRLAVLEVQVAMEAVNKYQPFAVLFDGGFLRYGGLAPAQWQEYRELSLAKDVVSIGIIEEIGTFDLARKVSAGFPEASPFSCDRELLFGILKKGEWLAVKEDLEFKKTYYTCFARPGYYPGAVAYDFFQEQTRRAAEFVPLLFGLTPQGGRGIPQWLDQVDAAVRITRGEMELLLASGLDRELRERLFVSQRERRTL